MSRHLDDRQQKKAAGVNQRPKSREETPKEGGGVTIRDRNAALQ